MRNVSKMLAIAGLGSMTILAGAQTGLYSPGRIVKDQGIELKSWGSGLVAEADDVAFEGTTSVRITTRNFFQGGILNFDKPVDLSKEYNDKTNLLNITFFLASSNVQFGAGGVRVGGLGGARGPAGMGGGLAGARGPAGMGGMGGPIGGGPGGMGGISPGGMGGAMQPGGGRATGQNEDEELDTLRLIVTTTDGLKSEIYIPIDGIKPDARGWSKVGVPLQAIRGFERTNKQVSSVAISANQMGTFYIGEIQVVNDRTPIYGEPNVREMNLALGDEVLLWATGYAGPTLLKYEWNFGGADKSSVDAIGQVVRRRFVQPGHFTITLTIADRYGIKEPYKTTLDVTVNP